MNAVKNDVGVSRRGLSKVGRGVLIALGLLAGLVGWAAWGFETEYGSGTNHAIEIVGNEAKVYDINESAGRQELVFEGTEAEARAFAEEQRTEGRNYVVPALILAVGAVLVVVGIAFPRKATPLRT